MVHRAYRVIYIYIYIYIYIQQLRIPPPRLLADSGYIFSGRSVCVSAFVCLPLGTMFDAFFVDSGFSWILRGHIKYTWNLKMTTSGPHLAGAGPRDRFFVNSGCILGAILETILHTAGHLWQLFASFRYPFCGAVFDMVSSTCRGGPM